MRNVAVCSVTDKNVKLVKLLLKYRPELKISSIITSRVYKNIDISLNKFYCIEDGIKYADVFIFLDSWDINKTIQEMKYALSNRKEVWCYADLEEEDLQDLKEIAKKNTTLFRITDKDSILNAIDKREDALAKPEAVVIGITSITPKIDTAEITVYLSELFKSKGYAVASIVSDEVLDAFGYHFIPLEKMVDTELDKTIVRINEFVNYLQLKEKPEVIIWQLPTEGIVRLSNEFEFGFGIKTYLITQAIGIDYSIVFSPLMGLSYEEYERMSEASFNRYGFEFNTLIFTSKRVDYKECRNIADFSYLLGNDSEVECEIKDLNSNKLNDIIILKESDKDYFSIMDNIINFLS